MERGPPPEFKLKANEEQGITVEPGEEFLEVTHASPDLTVHLTVLRAGLAEGEPQLLEHAELRWVTAAELPGFAFCPADGAIVQKLRQG